jgi:hypothetical protein
VSDIEKVAQDYVLRERSDYQLRHFVIGQHDTPQMQYRQIILEVKSLVTTIRSAELNVEKMRIKLSRLSNDPLDQIKAEKHRMNIAITLDLIEAARRELTFFLKVAEEYPAYTPQDIEDNQSEYWEARLQRQATLDRMSVEQQISVGNLGSMLNAGLLHRELGQ